MDKFISILMRLSPVIILVVIGYLGYGCYQEHQQDKVVGQNQTRQQETNNTFIEQYNALTGWEDEEYFTSDLEDLLVNSGRPVAFSVSLDDIEKQGDRYLLHFTDEYSSYLDYFLILDCDYVQTDKVRDHIEAGDYHSLIVIADITDVSKPELSIDGYSSEYTGDVEFYYDRSDTFLISGSYIDSLFVGY